MHSNKFGEGAKNRQGALAEFAFTHLSGQNVLYRVSDFLFPRLYICLLKFPPWLCATTIKWSNDRLENNIFAEETHISLYYIKAEQKRVILESRVRILRRTCAPLSLLLRERNLLSQIDERMSCVFDRSMKFAQIVEPDLAYEIYWKQNCLSRRNFSFLRTAAGTNLETDRYPNWNGEVCRTISRKWRLWKLQTGLCWNWNRRFG